MAEETIKKMRGRHKKEIESFQKSCPHPKSQWLLEAWAPGHLTGSKVRCCVRCESILERSLFAPDSTLSMVTTQEVEKALNSASTTTPGAKVE